MRHSSTFPLLVLLAGMITPGRTVIGRPPNFPEGWNNPLLSNVTVPFLDADSSSGGDEVPLCRHKSYLPSALFEWDTCAWCYRYMHNVSITFGSPSKKFHTQLVFWTKGEYTFRILVMVGNNSLILANASDVESPVWDTFDTAGAKKDWADCCNAARDCCHRQLDQARDVGDAPVLRQEESSWELVIPERSTCPPTWDGWQCWDSTQAGVTASSFCPPYIYFLTEPPTCTIPVEKECTSSAHWLRKNNGTGDEWTDYQICGSATVSLQLRRTYVLISAYALSIVAIIPALCIFFAYKQLRVHRIILHRNLFISMLLNGVLVILFKTVVMLNEIQHKGSSIVEENSISCRLLLILTKYSRMTNYMMMFCEGYYLHKLIAAAFAEQKSLIVFHLLGWVFPIFPTVIYTVYRIGWANSNCWVVPEEAWEWVLNGPSLLSLIVNALFLINIIRVLVTKLRATHAQEPSQYRKAVRATLVLLPLFGLHFLVTIYRPPTSTGVCLWTEIYFYANDILDGIQGFMVALIFCYFNGEVSTLLKRSWMRFKETYLGAEGSNTRNRRHGSFGRSVVSTHVYSSVPPSPETNCMSVMDVGGGVNSNNSPNLLNANNANNLLAVNGNNKAVNLMVTTKSGVESSCV
ncbi:calcitonin gene-related peptide type 1 receptor isoform X2 [Folsomia candida]|uniref:calcitonin gene-related peptide type 1 receptor isoform X2 n=1 Tax=Folsomia candida TaxID=158441 RepID=UPI001604AD44|nr:calcitonin gene-related peptide type 1 receptor isoform X2 [Folsomia candida]